MAHPPTEPAPLDCPLTDNEIQAALRELTSGRPLDPPRQDAANWAAAGNHQALIESHHWLLVAKALSPLPATPEAVTIDDRIRARIAAGYDGLARATRDFDPRRGYKFGTWASWWISKAIATAISGEDAGDEPLSLRV